MIKLGGEKGGLGGGRCFHVKVPLPSIVAAVNRVFQISFFPGTRSSFSDAKVHWKVAYRCVATEDSQQSFTLANSMARRVWSHVEWLIYRGQVLLEPTVILCSWACEEDTFSGAHWSNTSPLHVDTVFWRFWLLFWLFCIFYQPACSVAHQQRFGWIELPPVHVYEIYLKVYWHTDCCVASI